MKTRELIRRLQETDPSCDLECCVGNADILSVWSEPAYWDGCLQVLVRDPTTEYYNVVGVRYVGTGHKVVIQPYSVRDALLDDPDLPIDLSGLEENQRVRYGAWVAQWRQEMRNICDGVERDLFVAYMVRRLAEQYGEDFERQDVIEAATRFFDANLSHKDPMPDDIRTQQLPSGGWPSWNDRRCQQWDREIGVAFEGANLELTRTTEKRDG